ncbi:MAG: hypothetical protein ACR65O_07045 [Methylomicrobium sp.]
MVSFKCYSSDQLQPVQRLNGVQTGFLVKEIAGLVANAAVRWKERDRLDVVLLRALCELCQRKPEQAEEGFLPEDLAEEVNAILSRKWANVSDDIPDKIRRNWNKLEETWKTKQEGLSQLAIEQGLSAKPEIRRKSTDGGAGHRTRYFIAADPIDSMDINSREIDLKDLTVGKPIELKPGEIHYICEDITDAGWIARIFARGYLMAGWRRWVFVAGFISIILVALALILLTLLLVMTKPSLKDLFYYLIGASGIGWILWSYFTPLFQVLDWRIVVAPEWMQTDFTQTDRLLELRSPPRYAEKMLKAVRYTAKCPICEGKVVASSGGKEFFNRIIGRCEEAPKEHVFAFDHVMRSGKSLR